MGLQFRFQRGNQSPILGIQRADAAEMGVVLGHCQHSLAWHILAAQHIFQKRHHIGRAFRSAE